MRYERETRDVGDARREGQNGGGSLLGRDDHPDKDTTYEGGRGEGREQNSKQDMREETSESFLTRKRKKRKREEERYNGERRYNGSVKQECVRPKKGPDGYIGN